MAERRYKIMGDDSGHEYFVPVDWAGVFDLWVNSFEEDGEEYHGYDFEQNRIDGRFTFTDPRCE